MRRAARLLGRLMIVVGVAGLIAIVGWWWLGNSRAQQAQAQTVQSLEHTFAKANAPEHAQPRPPAPHSAARLAGEVRDGASARPPEASSATTTTGRTTVTPSNATLGDAFALIRIPRFGDDFVRPIVQGTGTAQLKKGVGHYLGTADPGQRGNFALAGHRTTYGQPFHLIAELRPGDHIIVETAQHTYTYVVTGHSVVDPSDVQVITADPPGQKPGRLMTMTSCHPMYTALQRYVVHARLVSTR